MTQKGYRELASALEFNQRSASGGIATREAKLKQDPAQVKAVIRATFEAMDFNRKEKSWSTIFRINGSSHPKSPRSRIVLG